MVFFDNIQGTNWQTLRFKLPPIPGESGPPGSASQIRTGWRIEFRSIEAQVSYFSFCISTYEFHRRLYRSKSVRRKVWASVRVYTQSREDEKSLVYLSFPDNGF